jgi:UDP-N-acetylglucosamine 2-epimerase (non-hydrolysing)
MIITIVAGARPNFMKVAPIIKSIQEAQTNGYDIKYRLVHTGQHYDKKMSSDFFEQLCIPEPDANLGAGGGSQAEQTAAIMVKFEKELLDHKPNLVLVVGDVTSTMACTIVAKKLCIDVAHVEAGIRSGDRTMPEEINRLVTDVICDYFFTTSEEANRHLYHSGVPKEKVHFVGNTMIDTLYQNLNRLIEPELWQQNNLKQGNYFLITLHRPSNVDDSRNLTHLLEVILNSTGDLPIVFPVHPRTRKMLDAVGFMHPRLIQTDPMSYLEFIHLVKHAKAVITDSGGITEETTVLGVPCLTLRSSTERPETVLIGTNELIGTDPNNLLPYLDKIMNGNWKPYCIPPLWDGETANRIITTLLKVYAVTNIPKVEYALQAS